MEKVRKLPTRSIEDQEKYENMKCIFCHRGSLEIAGVGKFHRKWRERLAAHYYCLVFSDDTLTSKNSNVGMKGFSISDIRNYHSKIQKQKCVFCKMDSANLGCRAKGCKEQFHLTCGLLGGAIHQYYGQFDSFCFKHRPVQKNPTNSRLPEVCSICLQGWIRLVKEKSIENEVLWAPCCKFTNAFHRKCVQQLAVTSGYFFKCPCCNNKTEFETEMQRLGIFVPQEDPSWQLEREVLQELTQPPKISCSAPVCLCDRGRDYSRSDTRWEMVKCCVCASEGTHKVCGNLEDQDTNNWQCKPCALIVATRTRSEVHVSQVPLPLSKKLAPSSTFVKADSKDNKSRVLKKPRGRPKKNTFKMASSGSMATTSTLASSGSMATTSATASSGSMATTSAMASSGSMATTSAMASSSATSVDKPVSSSTVSSTSGPSSSSCKSFPTLFHQLQATLVKPSSSNVHVSSSTDDKPPDLAKLHDIYLTTVFKVNDTGVYEIVNKKYGYHAVRKDKEGK